MTMSDKDKPDIYDVVVLGAGLYGIQAARCYLDIHPTAKLVILESDDVVGGTWSSKRIYQSFWTQTPIGMAEFSDRPMTPPPLEDQYYGFFPAKYVTEYLESYVDDHAYNAQTLRSRISFGTQVERLERYTEGSWTITCHRGRILHADKVIDCTGMTSEPHVPDIPGKDRFEGLMIHHKDFGQSSFLSDPSRHHIAVLGGAKSASDVAYACAKAGKDVHWIIREEGGGPGALLSAEGKGGYASSIDGFYTRLVVPLLPNPFSKSSYFSNFLHCTKVGRWFFEKLWNIVDEDQRAKADFHRDEGQAMGFQNLEPDTAMFWQNDSPGINQRPDFFSTIAQNVSVHRQSIEHLSPRSITLEPNVAAENNARHILVDVVVLCTGWDPVSRIFPPRDAVKLGLAVPLSEQDQEEEAKWRALEGAKDQDILRRFPFLARTPPYRPAQPSHTPFRLYKAIAPPSDIDSHSIAFLGKMVVGNNFRVAEVQALWAVAYLDGKLKLDRSRIEEEIVETVTWCRSRYLNKGQLGSWFPLDTLAYTDMLLDQLRLSSHRRKDWIKDLVAPCVAADLQGLIAEYKEVYSG